MQDIEITALTNQTARMVDLAQRNLSDKQIHKLAVLILSVANQWLRAYKLGLCTWTVAKNNAVMLDELSCVIDKDLGAA